jgi:hypothetical protein
MDMNTLRQTNLCVCASRNPKFISNTRFLQMHNRPVLVRLQRKVINVKRIVYDNIKQCQRQQNTQPTHKEYFDETLRDDNI